MSRLACVCFIAVTLAARLEASDDWVIAVVGHGEVRIEATGVTVSGMPVVDARVVAPLFDLEIDEQATPVSVRDAAGQSWPLILELPQVAERQGITLIGTAVRRLDVGLDTLARCRGGRVVVGVNRHAYVFLDSNAATPPVDTSAGLEAFSVRKSVAEIAEMLRLEGQETPAMTARRTRAESRLAPQHAALRFDVGAGVVSGHDGAADWNGSGTVNGYALDMEGFVAVGRAGVDLRAIRGRLGHPDGRWQVEGGDLVSELRGLSRGVRGRVAIGDRWRPGLGVYLASDQATDTQRVAAYRDSVSITSNAMVSGEVTSDRSAFVEASQVFRRTTVESFYRHVAGRQEDEIGGFLSFDIGRGFSASAGSRLSESPAERERWLTGGIRVPVTSRASVSLDQTQLQTRELTRNATSMSVLLPLGPLRILQRYQWSDLAVVLRAPTDQRQSQSAIFYTPHRRLQLSYQSVTQWYEQGDARQWDQVEATAWLTRGTMLRAAAKVPDVTDPRYFNLRLTQDLPRKFRVAVEYGAIAVFHPRTTIEPDRPRLLVMLRRRFEAQTPAPGGRVRGRVIDDAGKPTADVIVRLGDYRTTTDAEGHYDFGRVPAGEFALDIDPEKLDATLVVRSPPETVRVTRGATTATDLRVAVLGSIGGVVFLDANLNGQAEPGEGLSGVVLQLAGRATMTDDRGFYRFHNLPAGTYQVQLDTRRLRKDLVAGSPTTLELEVGPGIMTPAATFRVVSRGRATLMQGQQW